MHPLVCYFIDSPPVEQKLQLVTVRNDSHRRIFFIWAAREGCSNIVGGRTVPACRWKLMNPGEQASYLYKPRQTGRHFLIGFGEDQPGKLRLMRGEFTIGTGPLTYQFTWPENGQPQFLEVKSP